MRLSLADQCARSGVTATGCGSTLEPDACSPLIPTTMSLGNRQHIPIAIKELMITLQTTKGLKKRQVAELLDVDARTVRRVTKLEAETGSVVREPLVKGPQRLLNGIDCAVRCVYFVFCDVYTLSSCYTLQYLESLLERTPNLYLHELQKDLVLNRGIYVSCRTISRALQKGDFRARN